MRLLVVGRTGQLGREIARASPRARFLGRDEADLSDPGAAAGAVEAALRDADAVINAAAWTAVDAAEEDEAGAHAVNAAAPGAIARVCARAGVPFVHVSTDYVFGGAGGPFAPSDPTGPLGAYGRTKLAGEEAVRSAGGAHAILRTAWVFSAHGSNFVRTMLRLSETRPALRVVEDQVGGPTPARAIAEACLVIAAALRRDPSLSGTYHFSGAPDISWAGFARSIFEEAGRAVAVTGIPASEYPAPAARPADSRLDCTGTEAAFGLGRPDWREGLRDVLAELGEER